jgi:hypothetical protein
MRRTHGITPLGVIEMFTPEEIHDRVSALTQLFRRNSPSGGPPTRRAPAAAATAMRSPTQTSALLPHGSAPS